MRSYYSEVLDIRTCDFFKSNVFLSKTFFFLFSSAAFSMETFIQIMKDTMKTLLKIWLYWSWPAASSHMVPPKIILWRRTALGLCGEALLRMMAAQLCWVIRKTGKLLTLTLGRGLALLLIMWSFFAHTPHISFLSADNYLHELRMNVGIVSVSFRYHYASLTFFM